MKSQWRHSRPVNKEKRATGFWVPSEGAHVEALVPSREYLASSWSFTHEKSFRGAGSALRESTRAPLGAPSSSLRSHTAVALLCTGWMESAQPPAPSAQVPWKVLTLCTGWSVDPAPWAVSSSPLEGSDTLHWGYFGATEPPSLSQQVHALCSALMVDR